MATLRRGLTGAGPEHITIYRQGAWRWTQRKFIIITNHWSVEMVTCLIKSEIYWASKHPKNTNLTRQQYCTASISSKMSLWSLLIIMLLFDGPAVSCQQYNMNSCKVCTNKGHIKDSWKHLLSSLQNTKIETGHLTLLQTLVWTQTHLHQQG